MFNNNQVWIAILGTILIPLTLGGQQQEKPCSNHLQGLYHLQGHGPLAPSPDGSFEAPCHSFSAAFNS
jgi:hypothetical protein